MNEYREQKGGGPAGSSPLKTAQMKTYLMPGYIEYVAHFKTGGSQIVAHFKDGSMSGYGSTPARLSTASPVLQRIIESSELYLNGRICLKPGS